MSSIESRETTVNWGRPELAPATRHSLQRCREKLLDLASRLHFESSEEKTLKATYLRAIEVIDTALTNQQRKLTFYPYSFCVEDSNTIGMCAQPELGRQALEKLKNVLSWNRVPATLEKEDWRGGDKWYLSVEF